MVRLCLKQLMKLKRGKTEYAMTFDSIYEFAKTADISGIIPQIKQQVEYNTAISREGLSNDYGSNIGQLLLLDDENPSLETKCKARAAAGSDARMSGCPLPVVICSGSGNQGLTVSVPHHYNC